MMMVQVMWGDVQCSGHVGVMLVQLRSCGVMFVHVMWGDIGSGHVE